MSAPTEEPLIGEPVALALVGATIFAKRHWIIGSAILFAVGFGIASFAMRPIYRAAVVLAPATAQRGEDVLGFAATPLAGLASGLGIGAKDSETEEALAVLRSREFTENFIRTQRLMPKLFSDKWDTARGTWKVDVRNPPTLSKAYKYFDTKIRSIVEERKSGLITIQVDWYDPNEAAVWANELVRELNDEMRSRAIVKAEASERFLDRELQRTSTLEGRDAISRLMEAQVKQRMLASVTSDYVFRVVDKALPADDDDQLVPHKGPMIMTGALLGLGVGIVSVFLFSSLRPAQHGLRGNSRQL